jgi:hypothetical protein
MELGEESLDNPMPFAKIAETPHNQFSMVGDDLVSSLRASSQQRVEADGEFQRLNSDIEKYNTRKLRKAVTLNEDQLRKERIEEEQKNREKAEAAEEGTDEPLFADNYYNKELLSITLDYVDRLRDKKTARK